MKFSKFKTTPVTIPLYGHSLDNCGMLAQEPLVTGTFEADPIRGADGDLYGVFTVPDSDGFAYPSGWAGVYRISVDRLIAMIPNDVFTEI